MKTKLPILIACFLMGVTAVDAQAPQLMNYQAIVRDGSGQPLHANDTISARFTIHQGSPSGSTAYQETTKCVTNQFGLITHEIGSGGNLATVSWGNGPMYMQVEIDVANGNNFSSMGDAQLLSVPYALFAANSALGPTGVTGATGSQGLPGNPGAAGLNGPTGLTGLQGPTGPQGVAGATGLQGAVGAVGATGLGLQGVTGAQGPIGVTGATGVQGNPGVTGATGSQGTPGIAGATGLQGDPGIMGVTGNDGATGAQGPSGIDGAQGPTGAVGATGNNGIQGITGAQGPSGINGAQGPTGAAGPSGIAGLQGVTGAIGATGIQGSTGEAGPTGANGLQGPTGAVGATGFIGSGSAAGNTPYWNGTQWVLNSSNIFNDGASIGIGTTNPGSALDVNGNVNAATGFTVAAAAAAGNFLRGNGTNFVSSPILANDIPVGSAHYIQNGTAVQSSANFNISGSGTIGGSLNLAGNDTTAGNVQVNGLLVLKPSSLGLVGGTSSSAPLDLTGLLSSYLGLLPTATNNYYMMPQASLYPGAVVFIRNNTTSTTAYLLPPATGSSLYAANSNATYPTSGNGYAIVSGGVKTVLVVSDGINWTVMSFNN